MMRRKKEVISSKLIVGFLPGALLGIIVSWVVNCALAEISLNPFFSLVRSLSLSRTYDDVKRNVITFSTQYFGILFAIIGVAIMMRVQSKSKNNQLPENLRSMLLVFSSLVIVSGFLCMILDEHWFSFAATIKVPLYTIVGMSVCFAFTYSLLDVVNAMYGHFSDGAPNGEGTTTSSMIGSEDQVHLILLTSIVMGACFGMIFGLMDVEDQRGLQLRDALIEDEEYCIPVGIILGGVAGIYNQILLGDTVSKRRSLRSDFNDETEEILTESDRLL